jgi:hypothetical protein
VSKFDFSGCLAIQSGFKNIKNIDIPVFTYSDGRVLVFHICDIDSWILSTPNY